MGSDYVRLRSRPANPIARCAAETADGLLACGMIDGTFPRDDFDMDPYLAWLIAGFLLIIVELLSGTFYLLLLGLAAKGGNTLIVPTNLSDVSSVIASAMTVLDRARVGAQAV